MSYKTFTLNPEPVGPGRCAYLTVAGAPCSAPAIKGSDPATCSGHSGRLVYDPAKASALSAQKRRERAERRKMTAADHLAAELERNAHAVAERLLSVGLAEDWRALAFLFERSYGKPTERVETSTNVDGLSLQELRALRDRLLAEHPELRSMRLAG